ncbi:N-acetylmuramoyl-L-alanine amidase [Tropicibacter oceani]|uniref:N-acetylmuramoyl-L-alanine amidase n=1 Tax=Tropicibacter oceani TaxID=3058420 RepID=A0ABY8QF00_9RHOB|nr:N-acetylmuramoyl-L-alanine amidase [Tropicibacter oceani]WGW03100.1 N-acetylmuramoyl-L-alanine amidase [Tropicibacter oceani]
MARFLITALAFALLSGPLASDPAALTVPGEQRPPLTRIDPDALRGFRQDRITHITFHHEGFAGTDAALFARASKARMRQSASQRVLNINAYHAGDAGLGMIAYHYVVGPDGSIVKGRPVHLKPATSSTAPGSSQLADFDGHFAVMALGDFGHEHLTDAARLSMVRVMSQAQRLYRVPTVHIQPHKAHATTACPGKHILAEAEALARMVQSYSLQSELAARGCGQITPDGIFGKASQAALDRLRGSAGGGLTRTTTVEAALMHMLNDPGVTCR